MQITNAQVDINFVPLVPLVDPELIVYNDVSQILLDDYNGCSQSARKKLIMNENVETRFQETRAKTHSQDENDNALLHDENQYPELDPNDVSRCLNELPNMNAERANQSNCSSTSNQVHCQTF